MPGAPDDVDDAAPFAGAHLRQHALGKARISEQLERDRVLPFLEVDAIDAVFGGRARVVDENIDAAERRTSGVNHLRDAVRARSIARRGYDLAVGGRTDLVRCAAQTTGIARNEGDVAALARQLLGNRAADTQAGAGDERALAVKMQVHVNSP